MLVVATPTAVESVSGAPVTIATLPPLATPVAVPRVSGAPVGSDRCRPKLRPPPCRRSAGLRARSATLPPEATPAAAPSFRRVGMPVRGKQRRQVRVADLDGVRRPLPQRHGAEAVRPRSRPSGGRRGHALGQVRSGSPGRWRSSSASGADRRSSPASWSALRTLQVIRCGLPVEGVRERGHHIRAQHPAGASRTGTRSGPARACRRSPRGCSTSRYRRSLGCRC